MERRGLAMVIVAGSLLLPSVALAGGGGSDSADGTTTVVLLILAVVAAYLFAHFVVDKLSHRFLVIPGLEYVLLGTLIGPELRWVPGFDLTGLMPVIALAAGWFGLLRGTEFCWPVLRERPRGTFRVVVGHHLVTGVGVGAAAYWFLYLSGLMPGIEWREAAVASAALGCCAATDTAPVALLARRYSLGRELAPLLESAAKLGDLLVIFAFGFIFCIFHESSPDARVVLPPVGWSAVSVALGLALGLLFTPFLGDRDSDNGRFLALVGIITFASGAAYFLALSPLHVNLVLGVVIVNSAKSGPDIRKTLESTESPMALVLLMLAGALLRMPPLLPTIFALLGFVGLRALGKMVGSGLTAWGAPVRADLFRGLFAQGDVAVAMAVSFRLVFEGPAVELAYAVIIVSILLHRLFAPRMLRTLLVDAGDIQDEARRAEAA